MKENNDYMKYIIFIILIWGIYSCDKNNQGNFGQNIIYKEILGQLISHNDLLDFNKPPPPYFADENLNDKFNKLNERVFYLEQQVNQLEVFLSKEHEVIILDYTLPVDKEYFQNHHIGTSQTLYDTAWIGNIDTQIKNDYKKKTLKLLDLNIPFYSVGFTNKIPEPDTSFYNIEKSARYDRFYIQLSEIILNSKEDKGIFYYAISNNGNLAGFMKFCYIQKINDYWVIIDK